MPALVGCQQAQTVPRLLKLRLQAHCLSQMLMRPLELLENAQSLTQVRVQPRRISPQVDSSPQEPRGVGGLAALKKEQAEPLERSHRVRISLEHVPIELFCLGKPAVQVAGLRTLEEVIGGHLEFVRLFEA